MDALDQRLLEILWHVTQGTFSSRHDAAMAIKAAVVSSGGSLPLQESIQS